MLTATVRRPSLSLRKPAFVALSLVVLVALAIASIPWNMAPSPAAGQPAPASVPLAPTAAARSAQPAAETSRPQPAPVPTPTLPTPAPTAPQYSQPAALAALPVNGSNGLILLGLAAALLACGWLTIRRPVFVR